MSTTAHIHSNNNANIGRSSMKTKLAINNKSEPMFVPDSAQFKSLISSENANRSSSHHNNTSTARFSSEPVDSEHLSSLI